MNEIAMKTSGISIDINGIAVELNEIAMQIDAQKNTSATYR